MWYCTSDLTSPSLSFPVCMVGMVNKIQQEKHWTVCHLWSEHSIKIITIGQVIMNLSVIQKRVIKFSGYQISRLSKNHFFSLPLLTHLDLPFSTFNIILAFDSVWLVSRVGEEGNLCWPKGLVVVAPLHQFGNRLSPSEDYSPAPHNDVSVDCEQHIWQRSHNIIMELKNSYCLVTLQPSEHYTLLTFCDATAVNKCTTLIVI